MDSLSSIQKSYKALFLDERAQKAAKITTLRTRKDHSEVPQIVLCGERLPAIERLIKNKRFSSALISSGAELPASLIEAIKRQKTFSVIGLQRYLITPRFDMYLNNLGFETLHISDIREDIAGVEPLLRETEYLFLDMRSVKCADYPYDPAGNPNGLTSEEICQIARYAGFSSSLKAVFIYGIGYKEAPAVCSNLTAQVIWHLVDGIISNIRENPRESLKKKSGAHLQFEHKIIDFSGGGDSITFLKSTGTGRLWLEIPVIKRKRTEFIPCSRADYHTACEGNIPVRWLFYYSKLNKL